MPYSLLRSRASEPGFSRKVTSFLLGALLLTGAVGAYGEPGAQKLVVTGSSTIAPLAAELGKRFEELHPGVEVDVQSGGSSRGSTIPARALPTSAWYPAR
jgi:ABC-type phosphate transport system substrate-binding protein